MEGNKLNLSNNKIVYSLNVEDVQTVAMDTLHRKLSEEEIQAIETSIANNIEWHEVIQRAIIDKLELI